MTPCDEQLCEQESGQARQMDRGEIEVEEERRVRAKRVPVLPTDKEKDESEIMHMTNRSQCETEDSHKCSPKVSLVPRVTTDRRPLLTMCAQTLRRYRRSTVRWKPAKCLTIVQRLVQPMVCWKTLSRVAWVKCCSGEMLGLPFGYSSTQQGPDEKRKRWQKVFEVFASIEWHK